MILLIYSWLSTGPLGVILSNWYLSIVDWSFLWNYIWIVQALKLRTFRKLEFWNFDIPKNCKFYIMLLLVVPQNLNQHSKPLRFKSWIFEYRITTHRPSYIFGPMETPFRSSSGLRNEKKGSASIINLRLFSTSAITTTWEIRKQWTHFARPKMNLSPWLYYR